MKTDTLPRRWALLLVMAGSLASMVGTTGTFVTDEHAWRYLVAAGCFVQFLGWLLHGRHRKGGVA